MTKNINTLIFDIGGVLVQLGDFPVKSAWQTASDNTVTDHKDLTKWLRSDLAQAFEQGKISPQEFAKSFIADNQLSVSVDDFLEHFTQWPESIFPDAHDTLDALKGRYTLGVFSNTNELHWDRLLNQFELGGRFDHYFASHLLGFAKPAISSFEMLADKMAVAPGNILFFDDSPINVEAARKANWNAEQVLGFQEAIAVMTRYGLM